MPWLVAAAGLGGVISGVGGYMGAEEQGSAARDATAAQIRAAQEAASRARSGSLDVQGLLNTRGEEARGLLRNYHTASMHEMRGAEQEAMRRILGSRDFLDQGGQSALAALGQAGQDIRAGERGGYAAITGGLAGAEQALTTGAQGARGALSRLQQLQGHAGGAVTPIRVAGGPTGRLGALAGQDPLAGFETSPGYQFQLEQGEQAINRAASARGAATPGAP